VSPSSAKVGDFTVDVDVSDITEVCVDAIVNPANERLSHGGGCALAIANAAGKALEKESNDYVKAFGEIEVGKCCYTSSGHLFKQ
jgi:O-acetyl-ADP-ribose deacetylase (regulator of RNase III)